jgi:RNase P protein component
MLVGFNVNTKKDIVILIKPHYLELSFKDNQILFKALIKQIEEHI